MKLISYEDSMVNINTFLPQLKADGERFFQYFRMDIETFDRLCGLVVRVSGYRYRGLGFDSRRYQIF